MVNTNVLRLGLRYSQYELMAKFTHAPYLKVVSFALDDEPPLELPGEQIGKRYAAEFTMPSAAAIGLSRVWRRHLHALGDPETVNASGVDSAYLCHSVPAVINGSSAFCSDATQWARRASADYVTVHEGQAIEAGAHGVIRATSPEYPYDKLMHSFVSLGDMVIQVFNLRGNMAVTDLDFVQKEYDFAGPVEIAAPATAVHDVVRFPLELV